ncbi:DUF2610 domain-containing protein [Neoehrlichia mikurensis]|uniref:DUF2610 domain-containing protein n=1 Tax=Neoehrlichia mikurensis TaxID=89586 RepID=A0A9Q9BSJ9_9RICK|nr:DUF2610 domain-containing protein [Neoehrlichia mikurensis]QXK92054.1 DUF2610 domain-containing protein [Neoehrlichia mikurensis]QXK92511.1 DUF2610 domain-containing protein [Neoehrlichia mikurensis]QXK93747.1 DUF2610 domain-containing protein [Neoehrlichia mikurensis]UTO55282.1 DUF2610 domain-containing protein [Neoehrlichia mikurensis]UTO56202.1 DUF2610 domain-containing protein [Neoehrlichia mikurensis]
MPGIKKFMIPCEFGGQTSQFTIYIGEPKVELHPIHHQSHWLAKERGGNIPEKIINSLERLYELSKKNGICFADLCVYALKIVKKSNTTTDS